MDSLDAEKLIRKRVAQLAPELLDILSQAVQCDKLPSQTNDVYRLGFKNEERMLKLPKQPANPFIDRAIEQHNLNLLQASSINTPKCEFINDQGVQLMQAIPKSKRLNTEDLNDPAVLKKLATTIRQLHDSQLPFQGTLNPRKLLQDYAELASEKLTEDDKTQIQLALKKLDAQDISTQSMRPCHGDFNLNNILIDAKQSLWLIDWEFSARADPFWDIAQLSLSGNFSHQQKSHWLNFYCKDHSKKQQQESLSRLNTFEAATIWINRLWELINTHSPQS